VLFVDLDHFKPVNEALGHPVGDRVLATVAQRLVKALRPGDMVARIGGDEFAVLLPGVDLAQARVAAERLQRRVQAQAIPHVASPSAPYVTLSIGLAPFDPATMDRFDQLLRQADQALYRAKSQGRNCIAD
jgi:diguanylate cyclase (GGDEF)-like protein